MRPSAQSFAKLFQASRRLFSVFLAHIDLHSGHVFAVHITYANAVTTGTITDTVTGASATGSLPGDITQAVGVNAFVGFTGGTGNGTANQSILTWSFSGGTGCPAK